MDANRLENKIDQISSKLDETSFSLKLHISSCNERDSKISPMIEDYYFTKKAKQRTKDRLIFFSKICAPILVLSGLIMEIVKPGLIALFLMHLK